MRYFIKLNGDKIESSYSGNALEDVQINSLMADGFIEVSEKQGSLVNILVPQKFLDGKVIDDTDAKEEQDRLENINTQIYMLQERLSSTDYVAVKIAEGVATKEEYADVLKNRAKWRAEINELQKEI